ncbi:hypothetical protein AB0425_17455 [Actinosynnema sp. NPDC051121]
MTDYRVEEHDDGARRVLGPDGTSVWGGRPLPAEGELETVSISREVLAVRDSTGREGVLPAMVFVHRWNNGVSFQFPDGTPYDPFSGGSPRPYPLTELDKLRAEVARLRAGEDLTPREEGAWPTPGQLIARILDAPTAETRLKIADALLTNCVTASNCLLADHGGLKSELEAAHEEIRVLREALRDAIDAEVEFFRERMAALAEQNAVLTAALTARPPRLTVDGWAYRRRTRARTRSRR